MREDAGFYRWFAAPGPRQDLLRGGVCALLLVLLLVGGLPLWLVLTLPFLAYAGLWLIAAPARQSTDGRETRVGAEPGKGPPGRPAESANGRGPVVIPTPPAAPIEPLAAGIEPLTPREREVLQLLAGGKPDTEIAAALFINRTTASKHVANICDKLGARNRTEAVVIAIRLGLV